MLRKEEILYLYEKWNKCILNKKALANLIESKYTEIHGDSGEEI